MKNLKVKSIFFSLLAIMAVAVFMTSCEQESVVEDDVEGWRLASLVAESPEENPLSNKSTSCIQECYDLFTYLNQEDSAAALSQISNCIANGGYPKACNMEANAWLTQALESNIRTYNDCRADCIGTNGPYEPGQVKPIGM